jgi:hypothetical protein
MRRSLVLLVSAFATLVACSEPVGPYVPHDGGSNVSSSDLLLRGVVEMTQDAEPRLALRMSEILVVLRVSAIAKADLTAAVGATVTVSGSFRQNAEFQVSSYQIYAEE